MAALLDRHRADSSSFKGHRNRSTRVYFHVAYKEVQEGDEVRVVGDHPNLGSWEPEEGMILTTNPDIFPCWISSQPVLVDLHSEVEYKYIVTARENGVLKTSWEDYAGNRKFIASGPEMTIEDDEGLYRQFAGSSADGEETVDAHLSLKKTPSMIKLSKEEKLAFVTSLEGEVSIGPNDTVFLFHTDLPIKVIRKEGGGWDAMESDLANHFIPLLQELKRLGKMRVVCIGWPGIHVRSEKEQEEIRQFLQNRKDSDGGFECIPVFPPQKEFEQFMDFCDSFLWPIFHDVMLFFQTSNPPPFNEQGWASYQHINNIFSNTVVAHAHDTDLIWIHDYHLMIMPTFISRKLSRANIGFYLHAPFPSSDSFKSLPIRDELLSGMLCADQVGFQFFSSARNFIVSCKRIYGLDPAFQPGGFMGLDYNGRTVMVKVAHFGLPYQETKDVVLSELVAKKTAEVKTLFAGKTIFVGQDRCISLSGLTPKIRDFRRFLREHPQYKGKVVLVQYCTASGRDKASERLMQCLIEESDATLERNEDGDLVATKTGPSDSCDVYVWNKQHDREDRLALFRAGHVLLDTSVKAGLNLMPFDFVTAHHDDTKHSVVIVSEFSGCSRVLLGSLRINPWSSGEVVAACERAMSLNNTERQERFEMNLAYTSDYSPVTWFEDFVEDLRRARKKEGMRIEQIGFGAKCTQIAFNSTFQRLPTEGVMRSLFTAKRRVFLFDNEGTLAADKRHLYREYGAPKGDVTQLSSHGTPPDEQVLQCLRELTADSRNTVVILSGRPRQQLDEWFSSVPKIGLCAERGFYYKLPSVIGDQWHAAATNVDSSWQSYSYQLMRQFVKRTQGAYIENKGSALVWQYRDADQHFGSWQAKELSSHLKELLFGFDVEVVEGKGYVEVKLRQINKGVAVAKVLSKVAKVFGEADFVLCVGDDRSDEDMFEEVNAYTEARNKDETTSQQSTTDEAHETSDEFSDERETKSREIGLGGLGMRKGKGTMPKAPSMPGGFSTGGFNFGNSSNNLASLVGNDDDDAGPPGMFYTCVVGLKPSVAKYYLHDVEEVSDLLQTISMQSKRRQSKLTYQHSANTWSGGEGGGLRNVGSMPALSSLAFTSPKKMKRQSDYL